jgi:hypothetical protein
VRCGLGPLRVRAEPGLFILKLRKLTLQGDKAIISYVEPVAVGR